MPTEPTPSHQAYRRWIDYRRKRFWALAVIALYVLGGFFLVPVIAKREIVVNLGKTLDRPVTLDGMRFNPLILSTELRGLRITEKDGAPLLGIDRLYVRLALDSLFHWAWSFGQISVEGFKGDIIRYGKSDTNLGRLAQAFGVKKDPTKPARDEQGTRIIVNHLSIKDARAAYTDHVTDPVFTTEIGPVTAEIDRFSTLPDKTGQQHILIDLEHGSFIELASQSSLDPLTSSGHIKAKGPYLPLLDRYLGEAFKLSIPSGSVETELDYHLDEKSSGDLAFSVEHFDLAIKDLAVRESDTAANPFVRLPELRVAGGHMAWPERTAGADSLVVTGLDLSMRREQNGKLAPMAWPASDGAPPEQAPVPAGPSPDKKQDWSFTLGKAEVKNAKAHFEDRSLRQGGKIEIDAIDVSAEQLSNKPDASFPFSAGLKLASGGALKVEGKASVLPKIALDGKLTLADLPVALVQPYLHDSAKLGIDDGKVDLEGDFTLHDPDGVKVSGHGDIRALRLKDEVENTSVISWDKLDIEHYSYHQSANELRISEVTLSKPFLRFQVAKDQTNNFSHIIVKKAPAAPAQPAAAVPAAPSPAPAAPSAAVKVNVGKITVADGSADYGDASLPLPFATHVTNLQGKISALSSVSVSASNVSLQGQVDQYGEVNVFGKVNPFQVAKGMKVNVVFRNVDFPGLSPYSVKFAGRRIAQGKVDLESQYAIDQGALKGSNKIVIRDMELGERVDVPGALDLPLELAISLLKDDEGNINLDLPVNGNVNDPQFDFGGVITRALADVLSDLVTAPFRALAGLFGSDGGDKLDHIDFLPGRSDLEPPEKEKIQHIAEILQKRPKIGLAVSGVIDQEADRRKLQHEALDAEMAKELGDHDTVARQRGFLESVLQKRAGKDKLASVKQAFLAQSGAQGDAALDDPGYVSALRSEAAKTETIDEKGFAALAQARGDAVANALKQVPGMDPKRITVKGTKEAKVDDDGRIELKLEAAQAG